MKLISAQEVAKIMGCAESTIRTNAKKGTLGFIAVKVGSLWKFRDSDVYEYVYGKNWSEIVHSAKESEEVQKTLAKEYEPTPAANVEPEPSPAPMSARPTNVIPLGAQEVKFEE